MDTNQIANILKNDPRTKRYFKGVYAADQLPSASYKEKECYVVNTDPSYERGAHWLAIFFDHSGGEFFDSYGYPPVTYNDSFMDFMEGSGLKWSYNKKRLQGTFSTVCGQYCVYYLVKRCNGKPMKTIVNAFGNAFDQNDKRVNRWFNHNYNASFSTHDSDLTLSQIARSFENREVKTI